jgi:rSAM/selenodomain-associated transferase 1
MKNALIIFVRNPVLGKVKTRLAATVGDEVALNIYKQLLQHTFEISKAVQADKFIFYAEQIIEDDIWQHEHYYKKLQKEGDLGIKMMSSFELLFERGYNNVCVIGSDCFELTSQIIEHALFSLQKEEVVIGPAKDGGYYLLGMKKLHKPLFQNKKWSTSTVLTDTIKSINELGLTFAELPELSDVDKAEDIPAKLKAI